MLLDVVLASIPELMRCVVCEKSHKLGDEASLQARVSNQIICVGRLGRLSRVQAHEGIYPMRGLP